MNFDEEINRVGTHSMKWDMMERLYGVPAQDGISMWVAEIFCIFSNIIIIVQALFNNDMHYGV